VWTEGDVVRKLRAMRGWTLQQLQIKSGVNIQVLHRIESGKTKEAKRATLDRIAAVFGVTSRHLLDAVPPPSHIVAEPLAVRRAGR
jgi:transcriptional regulator with XRE-family HTH domain